MRRMPIEELVAYKGLELIASGKSDDGQFLSIDAKSLEDGLYLFTYANNTVFFIYSKDMLDVLSYAPIRVCMPVIYDNLGSVDIGYFKMIKSGNDLIVSVQKSLERRVRDNLTGYLYKTKLA